MNNVISYSLFQQFDKHIKRPHDKFATLSNRYWENIPFIVVANQILFGEKFKTRIHMPEKKKEHELYCLFEKMLNNISSFEVDFNNKPYTGTEPTIWRLKPLWDPNIEYCFCRDIDSIPTYNEVKVMTYFMNNKNYLIHNIRSIPQHNGEGTSIMAGLSGFNVPSLNKELPLPSSFENYEKFYNNITNKKFFLSWRKDLSNNKVGQWGCDQDTLIAFFIKTRPQRIIERILDTFFQPHNVERAYAGVVKPNTYFKVKSIAGEKIINEIDLSHINQNVINIINKTTQWMGQPVNTNNHLLQELLSLNLPECKIMKSIIKSNTILNNFYKT